MATRKGLAYWPFKIRAVQRHTKRAMETASASEAFNAVEIYASSGAAAIQRMSCGEKGGKILGKADTPANEGKQEGVQAETEGDKTLTTTTTTTTTTIITSNTGSINSTRGFRSSAFRAGLRFARVPPVLFCAGSALGCCQIAESNKYISANYII